MSFLNQLLRGKKVEWQPLGDITNYEQPTKYLVESKNYSNKFKTPVLTAGKTFILGYTDETEGIYKASENPVIIFDDFTTANKWVDFDFKAKSSAMKMITSKDEGKVLLKYIFYWLNSLPSGLVEGDHKRQWISKYSMKLFPIPELKIQKEIVRILDSFTELTTELNAELTARKHQYSYYREQLFIFEESEVKKEKLGEIGEFQRGKRFVKTDLISEGVPTIHYGEMYTHYGTWANETISFVSEELVNNKKLRVAEKGDVVIVAAGETIEDIGMGTAWLGDEGVVIHDACFSFRSSLNPKYVAYYTRTRQFHDQIRRHISSGKISSINSKGLSKVLIPVPSKEVQERIVSILDKFDVLTSSISEGLPKEIELRRKQYEYYREMLLSFPN
ncbi:MAG: restriction endonuclease subunit S [Algoriphagus sp.]|uniref:restriction endonuclease subunit S n=1 Tax=Algoriphagus sp. TaxID=1872435 RepID=UPI0017C9CDC5|nr:restriction endonuclease subunit S [Algoriphagus sp.]NVJ85789.1 restriction endonuclease subunit S [Algoriphagus sp.]